MAKDRASELKAKGQDKYGEQIDQAAEQVKNLTDQAAPYVDKAKDLAATYVDKAQDSLHDLRDKFGNEDIELTQDDLTLEEALRDLSQEAESHVDDAVEKTAKKVDETAKVATEKATEINDDVQEKLKKDK